MKIRGGQSRAKQKKAKQSREGDEQVSIGWRNRGGGQAWQSPRVLPD